MRNGICSMFSDIQYITLQYLNFLNKELMRIIFHKVFLFFTHSHINNLIHLKHFSFNNKQ